MAVLGFLKNAEESDRKEYDFSETMVVENGDIRQCLNTRCQTPKIRVGLQCEVV